MKIKKNNSGKILRPYFLIHGTLDIDSKYFIKEIDNGITQQNNKNFQTNVVGAMTDWKYFKMNKIFLKALLPIFDYLDDQDHISRYSLEEAWGIKEDFTNYTSIHNHSPHYLSGTLYLNSHPHTLLFPEIKFEHKPVKNSFVIFSSFLNHKTIRNTGDKSKYAISFNLGYLK